MKTLLLAGASVAVLAVPTFAQARQAAASAPDVATPATGQFAEPLPPEPNEVQEVVVTALRRETRLQDTPVAVSVMSAQALESRQVESLLDLADGTVPSLRVATFEARRSALTIGIRGIVPLDANQPAREQGVGVYIDGVYMGRQHGLDAALLDVERIEVLRGPQGTLFGRNAEGGALNIVTRRPSGVFDFRGTVGIGNYGGYQADLHMNLPAWNGLSFKVDAVLQHRDATTENPLAGQEGWNFYDRQGVRAQLRWRPNDRFTADLAVDRFHSEDTPYYSQLVTYNSAGLPVGFGTGQIRPLPGIVVVGTERMRVADVGVPQEPSVGDQLGVSLNLSWRALETLEFRSITAYRDLTQSQWDNAGGAHRPPVYAPNGAFSRYSLANLAQIQYSQEFQAVGSLPQIDYVAGVFFFSEIARDDAATPNTNRWNADGTGYTILDLTPTRIGSRVTDRASRARSHSWAIYGQFTWTPPVLDDRLHLTLGGRYTNDEKDGVLYVVNNVRTNFTFSEANNRFDPLVTLAFQATPGINIYGTYATGYRAGGASSRSLTYRSFGPEEVTSYELGVKTDFWERRARVNVALFHMDRTASQIDFSALFVVNNTNRNTLETINAPGTTTIRGLEVEASMRPVDGLNLTASYTYTETDVPPTLNPFTGVIQPVFIVFTPRNAWSVAADWSRPIQYGTIRVHVDANYAQGTQTFDQEAVRNDSRTLWNARLSLADIAMPGRADGRLTVSAWVRNLFNESYIYRRSDANRLLIGDYANFGDPRTLGVEVTAQF